MDRLKGVTKGGWHPPGDPKIHRETWKSDLKGLATGKKKDPNEDARNHQSTPLSTLKDPDSFGPPPKHSAYYGSNASTPTSATAPQSGWGSAVPVPSRRKEQEEEERRRLAEERANAPLVPYRKDTTGLRTDNLPKPPVRRPDGALGSPSRSSSTASPAVPPRQLPAIRRPQTQAQSGPPPVLPPRMTEFPDEHTPPPPPAYHEATKSETAPAVINTVAANRLGQAGVSVPGFGIGSSTYTTPPESPGLMGHGTQLSELQQRFARMNSGAQGQSSPPASPTTSMGAGAKKKPPPPPPPKKAGLSDLSGSRPGTGDGASQPPPLPLSSKPRPG